MAFASGHREPYSIDPTGPVDADIEGVLAGSDVSAGPAGPRKRRRYFRALAALWLLILIGLALLAPVLPLRDPASGGLGVAQRPFGDYILGTDQVGRDMFSRTVFGARTSIWIAGSSVGIAMTLGVGIGLFAGYIRGKFDTVALAIADIILAFPGLVLLMVVAALAGPSLRNLVLAIAVFQFPTFIRLGRASTVSFAEREFVHAARGLGASGFRVATREVLPNVIPAVSAYAFAATGVVFVVEGSLSFLGLGVQPPTAAWGSMISTGRPMLPSAPHIVLVPAIVLFLTVLSFNLLADARRGAGRPPRLGG